MVPRHSNDVLHPYVYRAIIVLTVVFVMAAWGFAVHGYTSLVLGVVTFFGVITIGIPLELRRIWLNHRQEVHRKNETPEPIRDWLASDFDVWQDHLSGAEAAITLLLPIAAAALGALTISIVFQIVSLAH